MAITVAELITNHDTFIGDQSTDRISQAERFQFLTEATAWLQEELGNDSLNTSYAFNYYDSYHKYKITSTIPDILDVVDLVRAEKDQTFPFMRVSPRDVKVDIGNGVGQSEYALERLDTNWYLWVNHQSKYSAFMISSFESLTADGGTWAADTVNSDATNVTIDNNSFTEGTGSLNFDISVSQSGNNRATIQNTSYSSVDLSDFTNLAAFLIDVDLPTVTYITSMTFYWGSSTSNYYSITATTDINGNAFVVGTNTMKFNWATATTTGTPDNTAMTYFRIDINYSASQANATDFRLDNLRLVRPEPLTFIYTTWYVGTSSVGAELTAFSATSDIPFFSGKYDQYKYAVAHKAAASAYRSLRLYGEADKEEAEAQKAADRVALIIPSSVEVETKSFKVAGINFNRSGRRNSLARSVANRNR